MNQQTYELLPEHIPLMADAFAPFGADAHYIYDRATCDGSKIPMPKFAVDPEFFGNTAFFSHRRTDNHGNTVEIVNLHSQKTGETITFSAKAAHFQLKGESNYTPQPQISEAEKARKAAWILQEQAKQQAKTENAAKLIAQHETAPHEKGDFAYLVKKLGNYSTLATTKDPHLKRDKYGRHDCLMIPAFGDLERKQKNMMQIIFAEKLPAGTDRIYQGATSGNFHYFGKIKDKTKAIQFAEGYITGMTAHLANNKATVIAFDAGNLPKVLEKFAEFGFKNLEILADNDIHADDANKENKGLTVAYKAAIELSQKYDGLKIKVFIPELDGMKCDYNDIFKAKDLDAVRLQLAEENAVYFQDGKPSIPEKLKASEGATAKALTPLQKVQHAIRYNELRLQTTEPKNRHYWENRLLDDLLKGCPKWRTVEEIVLKASKAISYKSVETIRAEVERRYSEKLARVKREKSATVADLVGVHHLDISKADDAAKIVEVLQSNKGANFFFHIPMGYGKTEYVKNLMDTTLNNVKTLVVLPRVSLSLSIANTFDINHYKESGRDKYNALHVACVVNSMPEYLRTMPQVAIFDEMTITLQSVIDGGTLKKTHRETHAALIKLVAGTHSNICLDADTDSQTVAFTRKHSPEKPCYIVTDSSPRKYPLPKITYKGDCHDNLRIEMLNDIKAGLNIYGCSDSKAEPKKTKAYFHDDAIFEFDKNADKKADKKITDTANFLRSNGVKRLLLVTQETKDDANVAAWLADPNEESKKYACLLVSPTVNVGFSILGHFDKTYALMGSGTCTSNEVAQSLYRCRTVKEIVLSIKEKRKNDELEHAPTAKVMLGGHLEIIKKLNYDELSPLIADDELAQLYFQQKENRNKDLADFANNVLLHLENIGFEITHDRPTEIKKISGLSEKVKDQDFEMISGLETKSVSADFAKELEKKKSSKGLQSWESATLFRYYIEVFAGVHCFTELQAQQLNDQRTNGHDPITREVFDDYAKLSKQVTAYENTQKPRDELLEIDNDNYQVRICRSETLERDLFHDLLSAVKSHGKQEQKQDKAGNIIAATNEAISANEALAICNEILKPQARHLAANGHANYDRELTRPTQTLRNLFVRFGHNLKLFRRDGTNSRATWYEVVINPKVKHYADSRAENLKRSPHYNATTYQTAND